MLKIKNLKCTFVVSNLSTVFIALTIGGRQKGLREAILRDQYWQDCRTKNKLRKCSIVSNLLILSYFLAVCFVIQQNNFHR